MKKKLLVIALVAGCLALCSFKMGDWVTYKSTDAKFQAEFPVTPTETKDVKESSTLYKAKAKGESAYFTVSASVFKTKLESKPESLLDVFAKALNATVEDKKTFEVDGHQGVEAKVKGDKDVRVNYRVLIVENILYQTTITSVKEFAPEADVTKFFNSFKLL